MAKTTMDPVEMVRKTLEEGSPDVVRSMVQALAEAMMSAEADAMCGAEYGERSPSRTNHRNGYRERRWDTRVGTIDLAIPTSDEAATTRTGCWSPAAGARRRSSP